MFTAAEEELFCKLIDDIEKDGAILKSKHRVRIMAFARMLKKSAINDMLKQQCANANIKTQKISELGHG